MLDKLQIVGGDVPDLDAQKYRRLLVILKRAIAELQGIENELDFDIEALLTRLLPELKSVLNAAESFIAVEQTCEHLTHIGIPRLALVYPIIESIPHHNSATQTLEMSMLFQRLIVDGGPIVIDSLTEDKADYIPGLEILAATCAILVKIEANNRYYIVGLYNKVNPELGPFLAADGVALDNIVKLLSMGVAAGERRRRELFSIQEISAAMTSTLELDDLLPLIVEHAADVFSAQATSLMLWDAEDENLVIKASAGLSSHYVESQRIPKNNVSGILKRLVDARVMAIPDLFRHPLGDSHLIEQERLRSSLSASLVVGDRILGALNIYSKGVARTFTVHEQELVVIFANHATAALHNALTYKQRLHEQTAIHIISASITDGTTEEVSDVIVQQAVELTDSTYATLWSINKAHSQLKSVSTFYRGDSEAGQLPKRVLSLHKQSLSRHVVETQQSHYAADIKQDMYYRPDRHKHTASVFCVPLIVGTQLLGTLYVASNVHDGIRVEQRRFIDQLAPHAATALHHARLQEIQKRVIEFQQKISDVLPLDQQMTQIREQLQAYVDISGLFIARYDSATERITYPKAYDLGRFVDNAAKGMGQFYGPHKLGQRKGFVEWVLTHQQTLLVDDFNQWSEQGIIEPDERLNVKSCLVVPMRHQNQIVGAVGLRSYHETRAFDIYDRQFIEDVARHIAVIIENSEWFLHEEEQISLLKKITQFQENVANILSLEQQAQQIREELQRHIDATGFFIATFDEETKFIRLPEVFKRGRQITEADKYKGALYGPRIFGQRKGIVDWVICKRSALLIENFETWPDRHEIEEAYQKDVTSCLAVPWFRNNKIIGVIGLHSGEVSRFNLRHQQLLGAIVDHIATVMENAQTYEQRLRELKAVSRFQNRISQIDIEEREIQNIYQETLLAMQDLGMDTRNMYIALYREESCFIEFPLLYENGKSILDRLAKVRPPYEDRQLGVRRDLTEWIIRNRKPVLLKNKEDFKDYLAGHDDLDFVPERSMSWLGAPMICKDEMIGMIGLRHFERANAFQDNHRELLGVIASQAAVAIQNARLYESLQRRVRELSAINQTGKTIVKNGQAIDAILNMILEQAVLVTGACCGTLHLLKEEMLELSEIWPRSQHYTIQQDIGRLSLEDTHILCVHAIHENRYQICSDVQVYQGSLFADEQIKSLLAVVLRLHNKPAGVLTIAHRESNGLDRQARLSVCGLADLAALAIQNDEQTQALQEAKDSLLASGAVTWMGLFGSEWSHTVAQKTFSIRNYARTLKTIIKDENPFIDRTFDTIDEIAQQIQDVPLVMQYPATPGEGEPILVDCFINELVQRLCRPHRHIQYNPNLNCRGILVKVYPTLLEMALQKLVDNALRYMPIEGILKVDSRLTTGRAITIGLQDTGQGIPKKYKALFGKRQIPKQEENSGTGMGALLAGYILRTYCGGDLELAWSDSYRGTRLLVTLPVFDFDDRIDSGIHPKQDF